MTTQTVTIKNLKIRLSQLTAFTGTSNLTSDATSVE